MAVCLIVLLFAVHLCHSLRPDQNPKTQLPNADSLRYYRLSDGLMAAEKNSYEVSISDYKKQVLKSRDSIQKLKERIGSLNCLTNALRVELKIQGKAAVPMHDTQTVYKTDTVKAQKIAYSDNWFSLNGLNINDTLYLDYCTRTKLDIVTYYKRDKWLSPSYPVVNVKADNPNLTITGLDNYAIRKPVRFYQTKAFYFITGAMLSAFLMHL